MNGTTISSMNDQIREATEAIVSAELERLEADGRKTVQIQFPGNNEPGQLFYVGQCLTPESSYDRNRLFTIGLDFLAERDHRHPFETAEPEQVLRWANGRGTKSHDYRYVGLYRAVGTYDEADGCNTLILVEAN
jgi:hypothetical protein